MEITNYERLESFIWRVFNYYNGRINKIISARLNINWAHLYGLNTAGSTGNPNMVTIYPNVIARIADNENELYGYTLDTIIHELFHIDQVTDYNRMRVDIKYVWNVEAQVECMTAHYILGHINEIITEIGYDITHMIPYYKSNSERYQGVLYIRTNYITHLMMCIQEMCDYDTVEIIRNTLNRINNFIIKINDKSIYAFKNKKFNSIDIINNFLYDNYFGYAIRVGIQSECHIIDDTITVEVKLVGKSSMAYSAFNASV